MQHTYCILLFFHFPSENGVQVINRIDYNVFIYCRCTWTVNYSLDILMIITVRHFTLLHGKVLLLLLVVISK